MTTNKSRPKLTDILRRKGSLDEVATSWKTTTAAPDGDTIPAGKYQAKIVRGEAKTGKENGTPGYGLTFEISEGPYTGRYLWHDLWFTARALPRTKRDLSELGLPVGGELGELLDTLDKPLPGILLTEVLVGITDFKDEARNKIKSFKVLGVEPIEADPFAPNLDAQSQKGEPSNE